MGEFTEQQIADWKAYEHVRKSGQFNMFTEGRYASAAAGLSDKRYWYVMENYAALKAQATQPVSSQP